MLDVGAEGGVAGDHESELPGVVKPPRLRPAGASWPFAPLTLEEDGGCWELL